MVTCLSNFKLMKREHGEDVHVDTPVCLTLTLKGRPKSTFHPVCGVYMWEYVSHNNWIFARSFSQLIHWMRDPTYFGFWLLYDLYDLWLSVRLSVTSWVSMWMSTSWRYIMVTKRHLIFKSTWFRYSSCTNGKLSFDPIFLKMFATSWLKFKKWSGWVWFGNIFVPLWLC